MFHSKFIAYILLGQGVSWVTQQRTANADPDWREAIITHSGQTLFGLIWGASAYVIAPSFFWWLLPVLAGLVLSAPLVMLQVWLFVAPGLYSREKRFALPFVFFSTFFFVAGAAFSHYVVFPTAWGFLASFTTDYMEFTPKVSSTFSLYARMLLAFGLVFQMPTVVLALARMGVVTAGFLARHTKYAILIIFIVAAVVTPTSDVVTQAMMAAPMIVLYGLSIVIAWIFGRRKASR